MITLSSICLPVRVTPLYHQGKVVGCTFRCPVCGRKKEHGRGSSIACGCGATVYPFYDVRIHGNEDPRHYLPLRGCCG